MEKLSYKLVEHTNEYEAICVQHPFISWIADTKEEALEGVVEFAYQFYRDKLISLEEIELYIGIII